MDEENIERLKREHEEKKLMLERETPEKRRARERNEFEEREERINMEKPPHLRTKSIYYYNELVEKQEEETMSILNRELKIGKKKKKSKKKKQ